MYLWFTEKIGFQPQRTMFYVQVKRELEMIVKVKCGEWKRKENSQ